MVSVKQRHQNRSGNREDLASNSGGTAGNDVIVIGKVVDLLEVSVI